MNNGAFEAKMWLPLLLLSMSRAKALLACPSSISHFLAGFSVETFLIEVHALKELSMNHNIFIEDGIGASRLVLPALATPTLSYITMWISKELGH